MAARRAHLAHSQVGRVHTLMTDTGGTWVKKDGALQSNSLREMGGRELESIASSGGWREAALEAWALGTYRISKLH